MRHYLYLLSCLVVMAATCLGAPQVEADSDPPEWPHTTVYAPIVWGPSEPKVVMPAENGNPEPDVAPAPTGEPEQVGAASLVACGGLAQEAESGTRTGKFAVTNDSFASGGSVVQVPDGAGSQGNTAGGSYMTYCFNVATAGTYRIKARTQAASAASDSFYVTVDGWPVEGYLWELPVTSSYQTSYVTPRGSVGPVSIPLNVGSHTIRVYLREDGARLDTITLELLSTCGPMQQEAEAGIRSGRFSVGNDQAASDGQYVHVANTGVALGELVGNSSYVRYCFNVPTTGTYRLQARVFAASGSDDSFFVTVDGAPLTGFLWELPSGTYQNDYVSARGGPDPVVVRLSAGQHTVHVYLREDGARLDQIGLEAGGMADNSIYWGAYVRNAPWNMADLDAFAAATGKEPSILHFGLAWQQSGVMKPFPTSIVESIRQRGSIPMINWSSWHLGQGANQPAYKLTEITNGRYDSFIRSDHEMDGTWSYPWSVNLNGNAVGDFVPMWRHVHDIFESAGASNVTWVWCPNKRSGHTTPYAPLYPGDAYVDWTCIDGYNWNNPWMSFTEVFRGNAQNPLDSYAEMLAVAPNKPIMIGETASDEADDGGTRKAAWIRSALQQEIPYNFPAVKAVVWFNWSERVGYDWVVTSSPAATAAFRESIGLPMYTTNTFRDLAPLSPVLPLR
jgi:mannan endo-1,4-beta-mannosidase